MKKIFANGYGSIGSRIAAFLMDDPEVSVIGVGKYSPDGAVEQAVSNGLAVYVPKDRMERFSGHAISGTIESALDECDLVIDASPGGQGAPRVDSEPRNSGLWVDVTLPASLKR